MTVETDYTLTSADIKALKAADRVCFSHTSGEGYIRGIKRIANPAPYENNEREHMVTVVSSFAGRHANGDYVTPENSSCFASINGRHNDDWQTIVSCLRAGDVVRLSWSADGERTGYVERSQIVQEGAGQGESLHVDTLRLKIRRGKRDLSFVVESSTCPDNTARMIRRK